MACAAMLASAVALNSCKSNDPVSGLQGDADAVKTEFSISIPAEANGGGVRRMPAATVQTDGTFQGMKNIVLVPFAKQAAIIGTDARLGDNIALGNITTDGAGSTNTLGNASNATVYTNVAIPLTTASFLFYGESMKTGTEHETGVLTATLTGDNPSAFTFNLQPIIASAGTPDATVASLTNTGKGKALIACLNAVANAKDSANGTAWKDYTTVQSTAMKQMFDTYKTMASLSSFQVARLLTDLRKSLQPIDNPIANAIKDTIDAYAASVPTEPEYVVTLPAELSGYPADLGLPDGAIRIVYDATAFRAFTRNEYTDANISKPDMYTYPSSLWYYANSLIKTSNTSQKDNYNNTNEWGTILNGYKDATAVNSLTRSVAIADTIQYAVARLDVKLQLKTATLLDNDTVPVAITPNAAGFPVSAVFIGNQKNVGFDFNPRDGAEAQTIYDNSVSGVNVINGSLSNANSTLVLPTTIGAAATNDVMIAIEFTNNTDKDFKGVGRQLIAKGAKFYLVAKLQASTANKTENQVFKQDYTTTATLTIASLANAYSAVPDLRTPQLELGMAVNLTWQNGNTYAVEIP